MDRATTEEKFHTAVELIRNLPKSGAIQPSNDLKLKFYSYFKQATEGPCELPRPGFFDIVNRAKWDAWNKLGNMSKEEAMNNYVQEFVRILENTPLEDTNELNNFIPIMGPYIEFAPKEVQDKHLLINGKVNKPLNNNSEDAVENYNVPSSLKPGKGYKNEFSANSEEDTFPSAINGHNFNGSNESDSDEFSDTRERVNESETEETFSNDNSTESNPITSIKGPSIVNARGGGEQRLGTGDGNSPAGGPSSNRGSRSSRQARNSDNPLQRTSNNNSISGAGGSRRSGGNLPVELTSDVNEQLALAVIRLQHIMEQVVVRLDSLEALLTQKRVSSDLSLQLSSKKKPYWSFFGISPKLAVIIFAWPFIVQWMMHIIKKRNRNLN